MDVFDPDGNRVGELTLSEKQSKVLEAGELVTVMFHTPQLLRYVLGERSGSFTLRKIGDKATTVNAGAVREFVDLQKAVAAAREKR